MDGSLIGYSDWSPGHPYLSTRTEVVVGTNRNKWFIADPMTYAAGFVCEKIQGMSLKNINMG